MFKDTFEKPRKRPAINVGALMDIPTGHYEEGIHGESILNGGLSPLTGICARPNNFKTAIAVYMLAMLARACHRVHTITYDTEGTMNPVDRFSQVSRLDPYLSQINYDQDERFSFTDLSRYSGDEWFALFRKAVGEKKKSEKDYLVKSPFVDRSGHQKEVIYPTGALIDSFSKFTISAVDAIYDKNNLGESGANTDAMTAGKAKNQMFNQMPQLCARTATYMILTAHLGDIIQMEMYPTDRRNLSYMPKDTVLKGVSQGFYSLPNNVFYVMRNKPLVNREKMPEYPYDNSKSFQGDTDLSVITFINLRGKSGFTGIPISLVVSQSNGILPALSEFHLCKENDRYGMEGSVQNYRMSLYPEVALSRTTVRQKLDDDPLLRRAVQITADMIQINIFHRETPKHLFCTPEELKKDLEKQGHDWKTLLNTRSYWVFENEADEHPLPFLSTMDLLKMRVGEYIPYWYSDDQKKKLKLPTKGE